MIPQYLPNETNLTIAGLRDYYNRMDAANAAVLKAENDLSNARVTRNKEFYNPQTGLVEIGKGDKLYIKAIFGPSSPETIRYQASVSNRMEINRFLPV